jgi:perosamine synthetase
MHYLGEKGIMSKIYFDPVHLSHFYKKRMNYECSLPMTEKIAKEVLTLPMHPALKKEEIETITQEITNFYG